MTCAHGFIGPCAECDGAGQEPERAARSAAQRGRQETREGTGRYQKMPPCHGGCGTRINSAGGDYYSHQMTDTTDSDGVNWGDRALLLCATCAEESAACQTVREFTAFVRVKVSARLAAAKANARTLAEEFEI